MEWFEEYDYMAKLKKSFIYPGRPIFVDLLWHTLRSISQNEASPSINCKTTELGPTLSQIAVCFDLRHMQPIGCGKLFGGDRGSCPKFGNIWLPNPVPNQFEEEPNSKEDPKPYYPGIPEPKGNGDDYWPPKNSFQMLAQMMRLMSSSMKYSNLPKMESGEDDEGPKPKPSPYWPGDDDKTSDHKPYWSSKRLFSKEDNSDEKPDSTTPYPNPYPNPYWPTTTEKPDDDNSSTPNPYWPPSKPFWPPSNDDNNSDKTTKKPPKPFYPGPNPYYPNEYWPPHDDKDDSNESSGDHSDETDDNTYWHPKGLRLAKNEKTTEKPQIPYYPVQLLPMKTPNNNDFSQGN